MKNLLIDFDGTLVDISRHDYDVYVDILIEKNLTPKPFEEYWELRRSVTPISQLLGDKIDVEWYVARRIIRSESREFSSTIVPFKDVELTLHELSYKYNLHVLSSRGDLPLLTELLDDHNLITYFTSITAACGYKIEHMKRYTDVIAMVGDTELDIEPANELGITSIATTTGIRSEEKLKQLNPTHLIRSFSELLKIL